MFRNPRENASVVDTEKVLPSTGRSPTPPTGSEMASIRSSFFSDQPTGPSTIPVTPNKRLPVLGTIPQTKISTARKNGVKSNQSILSFFGKAEKKAEPSTAAGGEVDQLFFKETTPLKQKLTYEKSLEPESSSSEDSDRWAGWSQRDVVPGSRFNEDDSPAKRRRVDRGSSPTGSLFLSPAPSQDRRVAARTATDKGVETVKSRPVKHRGGFIDDSSDEEEEEEVRGRNSAQIKMVDDLAYAETELDPDEEKSCDQIQDQHLMNIDVLTPSQPPEAPEESEERYTEIREEIKVPLKPPDDGDGEPQRPPLARQGTSGFQVDDFGPDDFDDEFFPEGEEFIERQYMEEQLAMERDFEDDSKSDSGTDGPRTPRVQEIDELQEAKAAVAACPICNGIMKGMSEAEASTHVNACLDGTAKPLPQPSAAVQDPDRSRSTTPQPGSKRFQRMAVARPGQANPFSQSQKTTTKSAFSTLMSGHAEDRAWAEAANNEIQSRGKPAYTRTCPFYKIMPGLFICVDAFRYGKVEGQNAYFLSHFHSDHYIGLTSTWNHGPIYASKISCNLMRQQLRVNPKWLVPLEFEKKVEVPDTKGVFVTMIPANHCPGSSLFLFEKVIGKNKDGSARMNRILHCGDFRACPAHIHHPLLKPEVRDTVSGLTKNQTIDVCYLDTTYLTPKYAFPSQSDVIDSCKHMCISLSKEIVDNADAWEQTKVERAGSSMKKFLEAGSAENSPAKKEALPGADEAETIDVKPKARGRLLVVVGTYSIGKERICMGIARALGSKIFAPPPKMRICRALEDEELNSLLTSNPLEAQVHMQMLMEIRAETLHDYLVGYKPHFSRVVGFRPTGWSYKPPVSRGTDNPLVSTILHSENWKSRFTMKDLVPQRGSTRESHCYGVPYSEHSSFRELTMFVCALRIGRVVPTVNIGSTKSREKMKGWIERWEVEKRKNGLFRVPEDDIQAGWGSGDGQLRYGV